MAKPRKRVDPHMLAQSWLHSHEEDTPESAVYRPATFAFPLSRGRSGFELKPDGTLIETGPAPDDRRSKKKGTWRLEGTPEAHLVLQPHAGAERTLNILSVDAHRLIVEK